MWLGMTDSFTRSQTGRPPWVGRPQNRKVRKVEKEKLTHLEFLTNVAGYDTQAHPESKWVGQRQNRKVKKVEKRKKRN